MTAQPGHVGVLILRAWVEGDTVSGLRATITGALDVASGEQAVAHAATVPEVLAEVERWLDALLVDRLHAAGHDRPGGASPGGNAGPPDDGRRTR